MSLRSAMAEHFGNLERMQGGGTVDPNKPSIMPTPFPPSGGTGKGPYGPTQPTPLASSMQLGDPATNMALMRYINIATTREQFEYLRSVIYTNKAVQPATRDYLLGAIDIREGQLPAPTVGKTTAGGGAGGSLLSGLQKILGQAKGVSSTLGEAAKAYFSPGGAGYVDTNVGGDTYHSPEWRPGELALMQEQNQIAREAQAATQRSDQATLAERMGEIEAAEQQSRRTSLLEAAQALFTAAGTAAPPGMTTYPGYEEGGSADVLSKIAGTTTPASLKAPITRKPVSFDVLNAFDLGPLKEQIAAIMMGVQGAKKGLVSMADGGSTYMDDIARYNAGVAGKTPDEIALINRYLAGLGGGTGTSANSLDAIIGQAIYEADRRNRQIEAELQGATIPNIRNVIAQTMGYNDTGQPTMDMRELLANTKANPRNIIEGLFLGRGMGLPADLSNVEAVEGGWRVPGSTGGGGVPGGAAGTANAAKATGASASTPGGGVSKALTPLEQTYIAQHTYTPGVSTYGHGVAGSPSGIERYPDTPAGDIARHAKVVQDVQTQRSLAADALARMRAGTWTGSMAAEGKVVSGPAISTVGERGGDAGTEYAFLPPGAVVAPKPAGEKPSMDGALRAIAAQLFKSGLGGMATGGSVMGSSAPTVTGSLPRSLLDAPALKAFMNPSNAGLPSVHKMPALFQPFGEGGPEAPNWLDPRAILAYAHGDPTERGTMESITSAYGWDPATALEMARRAMAGFGKPMTGTASYRPYWSW